MPANTVFLCHFEDSGFADATENYTVAKRAGTEGVVSDFAFAGNAFATTTADTSKGLSVVGITSALLQAGTEWTIDFWCRLGATSSTGALVSCTTGGSVSGFFLFNNGANSVRLVLSTSAGTWNVDTTQAWTQNTAKHVAIERSGGLIRLYLGGVLVYTSASVGSAPLAGSPSANLEVLWRKDQTYTPNAHIDELRISNVGRYLGSNFTPPVDPYPIGATAVTATLAATTMAAVIVAAQTPGPPNEFPRQGDLLQWLRVDEGSGVTLGDASGNGHSATINDYWSWSAGRLLNNNPSSTGATRPAFAVPSTFSIWSRHALTSTGRQYLLYQADTPRNLLMAKDTSGKVAVFNGSDWVDFNYTPAADGVFRDFVFVFNAAASTVALYVDGVLRDTLTGFACLGLGAGGNQRSLWGYDGPSVALMGKAAGFAVWSRALSLEEVLQLKDAVGDIRATLAASTSASAAVSANHLPLFYFELTAPTADAVATFEGWSAPPIEADLAASTTATAALLAQFFPDLAGVLTASTSASAGVYLLHDWGGSVVGVPHYALDLVADGQTPLRLPMANFQTRLRSGSPSYLQATIPNPGAWADAVAARSSGKLILYSGVRRADGSELLEEIIRVNLGLVSDDRGSNSQSLTLSGHGTISNTAPRTRTLTGISYRAGGSGARRYRCAHDRFLRPGDIAVAPQFSEQITVGMLTYVVGGGQIYMEISE